MPQAKGETQKEAKAANRNVCVSQERILASHPRDRGQNDVLFTIKLTHRIEVADVNSISARSKIGLDDTIKLLECGQASGTHPHNKVLILEVTDHTDTLFGVRILELVVEIGIPGYSFLLHRDKGIVGILQREGVIEKAFRDQTTRVKQLIGVGSVAWRYFRVAICKIRV